MNPFPSSALVATAIETACRIFDEDPLALARGEMGIKARHVAMEALAIAFPDANRSQLGKALGYATPRNALPQVQSAKKSKWWRDELVDEVIGAVVAERYGDQAA